MEKLIWGGKELTVKEASLLLWGDLANNGKRKRESEYFPLVWVFKGECPYCEFYKLACKVCLLFKGLKKCNEKNSLFYKWFFSDSITSRKYWATKIYNRILKMPDLLLGEIPPKGYKERENGTRN